MESQFGMSEAIGGCNYSKGGAVHVSKYNMFVKKHFKICKKENPKKTAPEIMKIVAKKWQASKK
jgi:hypothetical protein